MSSKKKSQDDATPDEGSLDALEEMGSQETSAKSTESARATDSPATPGVTPEQEAAIVGSPDDPKATQGREAALVKATARIGKHEYKFPYNDPEDIRLALYLGQYFTKENLVDGQILSYNFHAYEMLFEPDLGIELNLSNPTFTYSGSKFHDFQDDLIVQMVNRQALLLGDFQLKKRVITDMDTSGVDISVILDKPDNLIFQDIKALAQESTHVDRITGEIKSPVPMLKALYKYESSHKSRKKVLSMINRALNKLGGAVEFLSKMEDVVPAGSKREAPVGPGMQIRAGRTMSSKPSSTDF